MNGARALLPPKTTIAAIKNKDIMMGSNHHFFLSFRKLQMSVIVSITLNTYLSPNTRFLKFFLPLRSYNANRRSNKGNLWAFH